MVTLQITESEKSSGVMTSEHLSQAVRALHEDGFVVLQNVIETAHLDILREKMLEDVQALIRRPDAPFNWNTGNLQQDPPPFPPYLFRDVLLNEMAICVTHAILGPGVKNSFYSGNTALPGRSRQPVHADSGHLWRDLQTAHPACSLVVNVPVVDMYPENGSTEIWPGTHLDTTIAYGQDIKVPAEALQRRRAVSPPLQPTVQRGSILIRDIRLWHAGMPNLTDAPRPMIAMIHHAGWLETGSPLTFPKGTESFFEHPILRTCARFVEGPIDYLHASTAYEYSPET
jgi:ectoine hydroxylase-related dioxygenase (phytanoyl-CoA dioxygenase family)